MRAYLAVLFLDKFTRHCKKPIGKLITASRDTLVEGRRVSRRFDKTVPPGIVLTGSSLTLVNGRPVARRKDKVTCKVKFITSARHTIYLG